MRIHLHVFVTLLMAVVLPAAAAEHDIGKPIKKHHLVIGAVYLQPVHMKPELPGMDKNSDVHLEADIHAAQNNPQGFASGAWIPYLTITYTLSKAGSDWHTAGHFLPMVADDGPHYGNNVKLDGPGKYHLTYHILPPPYAGFFRHNDK